MSYSRVSYYDNSPRRYGSSLVVPATFKTLKEVDDLLENMTAQIKTYGKVTVAEYYLFTGGTVIESDSHYGWDDLLDCKITKGRYGYELVMPAAKLLQSNPTQEAYDILSDANEDNYEECVKDAMDCLRKTF